MHWLLFFFHVAVHHADVTVHDADVLCRRVGILLGSFSDLDAFNEQAQELGSQFVDSFEALCFLDEGFHICRRCLQFIQAFLLCRDGLLQCFLFGIIVSGQPAELLIGDTAQNIVLIDPFEQSSQLIVSSLHGIQFFLKGIDLLPELGAVLRVNVGRKLVFLHSGKMRYSAKVIQNDLFQVSLPDLMRRAEVFTFLAIFYAEACYYTDEELNDLLDAYKAYCGTTDYQKDSGSGLYYGEDDPTADYQMTMKRMRAQVHGKSFYPTFAVLNDSNGNYEVSKVAAQDWIDHGVQIENASLARVGSDYYAAYTTAQSKLIDGKDEQTIKKLCLQKLTIGTEGENDGKAVPGSAIALRKLVDNAKDNSGDGVYASGSCSEAYRDPYFSNIRFLNGKLGGLSGEDENFDEQIAMQAYSLRAAAETFLIFEMNGNTYVVPQESLAGITGEGKSGSIIPFFTRETVNQLGGSDASTVKGAPTVTNVTFGTDGSGNITAVYTRGENGAPGNAVYLTKYDPQSQTWGLGTRLAMRDMDTIEEAEANSWSASETAAAWYDTNDDGKADTKDAPSSFTFNRLRVGLAGEDKLLIVAEGTLMALEAVQQMRAAYDSSGGLTGLTPVTDEEGESVYSFQPRQTNGAYDTTNGVYALSFGMGSQGIGSAALYLSNYDLTPGSTTNASVSFVNSGDVAIRAGKSQPASITLYAGEEKLAEWQITENVRAGQEVYTASTFVTLPAGLKAGDKLYFTVNEDTSYTGSDAFSQSTKTADGAADTAACITVADRVELGYEDFGITMVGADENTVTLAADIHVGNRGSATSDMTYLRFQY